MTQKHIIYSSLLILLATTGCKKDNFEAPKSILTGRVVYQDQTIGLRTDAVQLELWQYGYAQLEKIPVYIAQDGTFSAQLFDGNYKLVRLYGNGPWASNSDSIDIKLNGSVNIDVPVDPYFVIQNETYQVSGNTLTATFNVSQVNTTQPLENIVLYIGSGILTDQNKNNGQTVKNAADITDLSQPITITLTVPDNLQAQGYCYVRIAVKATGADERLYTQSVKVDL